jgi:hypothetical protein
MFKTKFTTVAKVTRLPYTTDYGVTKTGKIYSFKRNKFLKLCDNGTGYKVVYLRINKQRYVKCVHRLVLEAFIGLCPKGMECCHRDGNKWNNSLDNLRWDTRSNNSFDSVRHGTHPGFSNKGKAAFVGEESPTSKLTTTDVHMIIYIGRTGEFSHNEIAKIYNVSRPTISKILERKIWKHIWL